MSTKARNQPDGSPCSVPVHSNVSFRSPSAERVADLDAGASADGELGRGRGGPSSGTANYERCRGGQRRSGPAERGVLSHSYLEYFEL